MIAYASHDTLGRMYADIRQLTQPIHLAAHRRIISHPPLLDQLRDTANPGSALRGPERRMTPGSSPPLSVETVDILSAVYVGISGWHTRLHLSSPPRDRDWQKTALHQLGRVAHTLAPSIADQLASDVHRWWRTAAVATGWRLDHLTRIR